MQTALSSKRSWIARIAVLAMVASLMAIAAPAGAAIDTSASCPDSIESAGFTDLAGVPAAAVDAINCIADYGISTGTSATTFDPFADVERWQMALFLTRQATIHGVALPDGSDQGFTDLAGVPAAAVTAINQLAQLDISTGTSATTFDPFADVERWQMALFLTRLITGAGLTLPAGADQGFVDLAGVPDAAVTAINQLGELDIADGTSATTFDPFANVERWAMALFLTRVLAADGIVPAGTGFIVTAAASPDLSYADTAQDKEVTVTTKVTESFFVDGAAATQGAFFAAATVGDLVAVSSGSYSLTNKTASDYRSGVIDDVQATTYDIVEPITGTVLNDNIDFTGAFTLYVTDGASVSLAGFEDDLQAGDVVASSGTGADASNIRTLSLTNRTVAGAAANVAAPTFEVSPFSDSFTPVATDSITIDGSTDTLANFTTELTTGDEVTVARDNDKLTVTLVNKASTPISGKVLNNDESVANTVDIDGAAPDQAYDNAGTVYIVNGVIDDLAGLEAALTAGDDISIVRADGQINTVDRVTLTDAAFSGTPDTVAAGTVSVTFTTGGDVSEAIDYTTLTPDVGLTGTGSVKYAIPGNSAATETQFTAALGNAVVNGGNVSVAKVGNDIVWTLTN